MMTVRQPRKAQSQTATGKSLAITAEAKGAYPPWPKDLVDLPSKRRNRERCRGWYDYFIRHRTPEAWQAADHVRVAMLARLCTYWEAECWLLGERIGGDPALADKWRAGIAQLSRMLGLSVAVRDPRLAANDSVVRAEYEQQRLELQDDDLLAKPRMN